MKNKLVLHVHLKLLLLLASFLFEFLGNDNMSFAVYSVCACPGMVKSIKRARVSATATVHVSSSTERHTDALCET